MYFLLFFILIIDDVCEVKCTLLSANQSRKDVYDIEDLVSELGLQFCTIVEIGQGICSLFLEVREAADSPELKQGSVAEVFLGECQCSSFREWGFCSPRLVEARGETCKFKEATGRDPTSQRVHRRMCDFDHMIAANNRQCDCNKRLDDQETKKVKGLGTCFRPPMPDSVCGRHSVCGVYACQAASLEGFTMLQCDKACRGKQPFCEDKTEKAPIVTSYWSEWTFPQNIGFTSSKVSEASCLAANTRAPAFDCLGPGPYCCPPDDKKCFCDVNYTGTGKKVRRVTDLDMHINFARSVNNKTRDRSPWKRLLQLADIYKFNYRITNRNNLINKQSLPEIDESIFNNGEMYSYSNGEVYSTYELVQPP